MNPVQPPHATSVSPSCRPVSVDPMRISGSPVPMGALERLRNGLLRLTAGQLLNGLMLVLVVVLLGEWCWVVTRRPEPFRIERGSEFQNSFRLEVNSATWVEWMQLDGIGPAMANRIVADREVNGPFVSIDDLERVPGIGSGTLDRIRPALTIRHEQKTAQRSNP